MSAWLPWLGLVLGQTALEGATVVGVLLVVGRRPARCRRKHLDGS